VAARQNAKLFGYYVSAYGREPGNQIGWSRMTRALTRGVNIFILFYPCNSSIANLASIAKFRLRLLRRFSCRKSGLYFTSGTSYPVTSLDNSRSRTVQLSHNDSRKFSFNALNPKRYKRGKQNSAVRAVKRTKSANKVHGGC